MKFIKKYLVLIVAAALLAGAAALSIFAAGGGEGGTEPEGAGETAAREDVPGDYFESFREDREDARKMELEYLDEVIAASAPDGETIRDAQAQKLALVENMEKEFTVESIIKAKGFEDAAVTFHGGTVNVVVKAGELSGEQVAQILDIVRRETGEPAENIKVMAGRQ